MSVLVDLQSRDMKRRRPPVFRYPEIGFLHIDTTNTFSQMEYHDLLGPFSASLVHRHLNLLLVFLFQKPHELLRLSTCNKTFLSCVVQIRSGGFAGPNVYHHADTWQASARALGELWFWTWFLMLPARCKKRKKKHIVVPSGNMALYPPVS